MRFCFFDINPDINIGSYRIWVHDLCDSLRKIGHEARIVTQKIESLEEEVLVFGKSSWQQALHFKQAHPDKKVGAINIPADSQKNNLDFLIVGSHEERLSLSQHRNIFLYPLIEKKFIGLDRKIHKNSYVLKVCFHGHHPHLFKFFPHLSNALGRINREVIPTELHVITGQPKKVEEWTVGMGRPEIKIFSHEYEKISEVISSCDIGLVPNILDVNSLEPRYRKDIINSELGLYNTDYVIRFKNKTNPGRAFVFYQHGIPVVHDISPSSFEMMALTGEYIVAHEEESWFEEIKSLAVSCEKRQNISDKFRECFEKNYDPEEWAKKLVDQIKGI